MLRLDALSSEVFLWLAASRLLLDLPHPFLSPRMPVLGLLDPLVAPSAPLAPRRFKPLRESDSLLELELVVLAAVLLLEALFATPDLLFSFSLELKNLNLSNIEFLLAAAPFCRPLEEVPEDPVPDPVELVELVEVESLLACLSEKDCPLELPNNRPPGVGMPEC